MGNLRFVAERGNERFEIIEGSGEGYYALRYVNGVSTHDYLQDDIEMAHSCAEEQWGVPSSAWRLPLPGKIPLWKRQ